MNACVIGCSLLLDGMFVAEYVEPNVSCAFDGSVTPSTDVKAWSKKESESKKVLSE